MPRSFRTQLLVILLPLTALGLVFGALLVSDLLRLESQVWQLRDRALTAVYAERFARGLEFALVESAERAARPTAPGEPWEKAHRDLEDAFAKLRPMLEQQRDEADPDVFRSLDALLGNLESLEKAVVSHGERAFALADSGKEREALRLLSRDLEALVTARARERIDAMVRTRLRETEQLATELARSDHWLVGNVIGDSPGGELLPAVFESVLTTRFEALVLREYKQYHHHLHAGVSIEKDKRAGLRQAVSGTLAQLRVLRGKAPAPGAGSAGLVDLEGAYARVRSEYARIDEMVVAGQAGEASAALTSIRGLLDEYVLASRAAGSTAELRGPQLESAAASIHAWSIGLVVLWIGVVAVTYAVAWRRLARPVARLTRAAGMLKKGDTAWRASLDLGGRDELGGVTQVFAQLASELTESSRKVRVLSFYDTVTGLPNRELFVERLESILLTAKLEGRTMGILTVRVDSLREVVDGLGHDAGDHLLRQVAERLCNSVRTRDIVGHPTAEDSQNQISRVGGSQFTILLDKLADAQNAAMVAERVLGEISGAFEVQSTTVHGRANVGISIFPLDGADADTLLANSKRSLQHARKLNPNTYQFFSEAMNARASRKLRIGVRLRGVLERNDLELHFQPFRCAATGEISGAEVLLRWNDEELGPVPPSEFIPLAEETGLIIPIGTWVLRAACAQMKHWQEAGYRPIRIAVNVSALQLRRSAWPQLIEETLRETGVSAEHLEIEITESATLVDDATTLSSLIGVQALGVSISLDDFGTGYSSLSYLRRFPISRVKIDRSFVAEIAADSDGTQLTAAILAMAQSLGLGAVAEGIETEEQARYLTERGCDELQGYLISRPVAAADFERFLSLEKDD